MPTFSIYDIFYTLENTRSFNERATHFNDLDKTEMPHCLHQERSYVGFNQ